MDTLITVLVVAAVVGFFAWKNKDKLLSLKDKLDDDEGEDVFETPYKVEPVQVLASSTERGQAAEVDAYNGEGDPPSQEAWTEWRNRQPASTRFAIPEVWKPAPVDNPDFGPKNPNEPEATAVEKGGNASGKWGNSGFLKVGKFPSVWPAPQTRILCNFVAGKEYVVTFTRPAATGVTFTPSANSQTSGAKYTFRLSGAVETMTSKSRSAMANYPVNRLGEGTYTLTVVADKDTQSIVTFK